MYSAQNFVTREKRNLFIAIVIMLFAILIGRLYYLQVLQYSRFVNLAEANRVRVVSVPAPRGIIYDRNGEILVDNSSQYNVNVIPYELRSSDGALELLTDILNLTKEEIEKRIEKNYQGPFLPAKIAEDVDFKVISYIEEHQLELPGVLYFLEPIRSYPTDANLSHIVGYVREISKEDFENVKEKGYSIGDLIGRQGVEKEYEQILKGRNGYRYLQVDAYGRIVGEIHHKKETLPEPGNDLYLTVDLSLQTFVESLIKDKKGAVVVMDSKSGEILSLVSKPDYPPSIFSGVIEPKLWRNLTNDPEHPLYNRATQSTYPPGSAFKMIAAISALENDIVTTEWLVNCPGEYRLGRRVFKCWKSGGHGLMNMKSALINSCNVYFYNLIRKIDIDIWADCASTLGFGSLTNIDLPEESKGVVPDVEFLDSKYGVNNWTEGYKLNLVIGQGDLLVTPLQMTKYISILANHGKFAIPHVGLKHYDRDNNQVVYLSNSSDSIKTISKATWEFIESALFGVVNDKNGTGIAARVKGLNIYGKTGTAQNPHGEPHSWFIGYSRPKGLPKLNDSGITICVLIEHGGSGGGVASSIASEIFNYCKEAGFMIDTENIVKTKKH
jgi:penicillin-binding protein 2